MTLHFSPLAQGFGAAVDGFDAQKGCAPEDIEALKQALHRCGLLLLSKCDRLSPERQAEIIAWFGPVNGGELPEEVATTMDNSNEAGRARLPFHSDLTFLQFPLEGISLHPLKLPSVDTSTTFVSNVVAWESLAAELREQIRRRKARHYYKRDARMGDVEAFESWHAIDMTHPKTGQPLLFVTEHHTDRIEGFGPSESADLLRRLFAHVYAPQRQYEHIWRLGQLVIWDNYAVQHARTREANPADGPRILQRVSFGKRGYADQRDQRLAEPDRHILA